jgi:hypothetical protein
MPTCFVEDQHAFAREVMMEQIETDVADNLMVGAPAIARFIYGSEDRVRDVYRNVLGLTFFKHGNLVAAFKSTIREELKERQRLAREEMQRAKEERLSSPAAKAGVRKERRRRVASA